MAYSRYRTVDFLNGEEMIKKKRIKGLLPLYDYGEEFIAWKKGKIYICDDQGKREFITRIPMNLLQTMLCHIRICERIFRLFPRCAVELDRDNILVSFHGYLYRVNLKNGNVDIDQKLIKGMNNPLSIVKLDERSGCDEGFYYGEYTSKREDSMVTIWKRSVEGEWKVVFEFEKNQITHVHNIIPDYYRNAVIILTGDLDEESGIWITKDNFAHVKKIASGLQIYRACFAVPTSKGIIYATDTPLEKNALYYIKEENKKWTNEQILDLPGSVIYGISCGGEAYFSCTVESDSRISGIKYYFSRKLAPGISDKMVRLYKLDLNNNTCEIITSLEKDYWPYSLCQFGTIRFAGRREGIKRVLAYNVAVKKYDNTMDIIKN